jgi:hypothetical protein
VKSGLHVILDNVAQVADGIGILSRSRVMVGIPEDKGARKEGAVTNAQLLYVHENGEPAHNIPARPTLKPGIQNAQGEINRRLELAGHAALDGKPSSVRAQLAAAGSAGAQSVKRMINSNVGPPLKPSTLAARKRRGVKRTNTLVDTGRMRNAVTYVVSEEK